MESLTQHSLLDHIHECATCQASELCAAFAALCEALSQAYYAAAEAKHAQRVGEKTP
jgi:hypothetical protein